MSEFVEKIIEEKGEEIKRETLKTINRAAEAATERFKGIIENLKEQAKIVLPVNVIDILAKGGCVESIDYDVPYEETYVRLSFQDKDIFYERKQGRFQIASGKYRVTLIMERLGPAEKENC